MKKLFIMVLLLVLWGCSYGRFSNEDIVIDMTEPFDIMPVLSDVREGASVDYLIDEDNSKLLVDIKYNDKIHHLEKEVELVYPQYCVNDNIELDLVEGISQDDFISVEDGVTVNYELNEEDNSIRISLSKGIWSREMEVPASFVHPVYSIVEETQVALFPGIYNIDDIVSTEEGVNVESVFDKEKGIISVRLSKGEWEINKEVKVNYVEPDYPLRYVAVEAWYDDYQQPWVPEGYIDIYSDVSGMVWGRGNIAESTLDFTYSQATGEININTLANTFWFSQEVNCDSEYNRPNYKEITQWKQNGFNYCRFVSNVSFEGTYKIEDGFLYLTYYAGGYYTTEKFVLSE